MCRRKQQRIITLAPWKSQKTWAERSVNPVRIKFCFERCISTQSYHFNKVNSKEKSYPTEIMWHYMNQMLLKQRTQRRKHSVATLSFKGKLLLPKEKVHVKDLGAQRMNLPCFFEWNFPNERTSNLFRRILRRWWRIWFSPSLSPNLKWRILWSTRAISIPKFTIERLSVDSIFAEKIKRKTPSNYLVPATKAMRLSIAHPYTSINIVRKFKKRTYVEVVCKQLALRTRKRVPKTTHPQESQQSARSASKRNSYECDAFYAQTIRTQTPAKFSRSLLASFGS